MFEEGQLYSAVTTDADGQVQVHLGENHPGFTDAGYRARRGEIAAAALAHRPGDPVTIMRNMRLRSWAGDATWP